MAKYVLGAVSNDAAKKLSPALYNMRVNHDFTNFKNTTTGEIGDLKKGDVVLAYCFNRKTFTIAKVTSTKNCGECFVVRIADDKFSWRVDTVTKL